MSATLSVAASAGQRAASFSLRRLRAGAAVRIAFGVVWPSALYSFGICSAAEAFGLPWNAAGVTDLGPSVAYIAASLVLFVAAAGATWSVDGWLRPRLGPLAWLASPTAAELAGQPAG